MPGPFPRCRGYDDDKNPVGKGCNNPGCRFTHPDSSDWDRAIRKSNNFASGPRQFGSSARNDPVRKPSGPWNSSHNANSTLLPETGNRWVTQASSSSGIESRAPVNYPGKTVEPIVWPIEPSAKDSSTSGGWSTSGNEWTSSGGGGWDSTGGGGWDSTGGSGWQSSGDGEAASSGAAGGSGGSAPSADSWTAGTTSSGATGGWATSDSATTAFGVGNDNARDKNSEDKGKQKADVTMRDPSPPPRPIPLPAPRGVRRESQSTKSDQTPLQTDGKHSGQSLSKSPIATPSITKPTAPAPLPRIKPKTSLPPPPNLKKMALELSASKAAQETGNIYMHDISDTQSPAPPDPKNYTGPMGRVALYTDNLKLLQDLVVSHVLLDRAQQADVRWKRTQNSEIYAHATPLTRDFLDRHRTEYTKKVQDAKKRQGRALKALISLPDFATKTKNVNPKFTKEVVKKYTEELRDWLNDLQMHKRLLVERDAEDAKHRDLASALLPTSGSISMEMQPPQPTAQELFCRGNGTWKELKEVSDELAERFSITQEQFYLEKYTRADDLDNQLQQIPMEVDDAIEVDTQDPADDLLHEITHVGDNLGAQAIRAANLFKRIDELQAEYAIVVAEKEKMNQICVQAEEQFKEFELSKVANTIKIDELTAKLHKLPLHRRIQPPSTSPPPVKMDHIVEHIRPLLLQRMQKEVSPIFEALRQRCLENQEDVAKEVEALVKPAVDMTDAICQRVMSMTLAQPTSSPAPAP
ncbi:hypothetical protein GALMADRAFT_132359 [Galerina marginata CBS 339.88]|uniref:C3H1-type domain-containing protein n=1 Tax=Galerina marginata (strain CBS 339.88) TaxID=685588 RepID=A0A067TR77_GALM3|nr:hypothetical protein GALMADRAFT_132359 [Galerina marginata CBS 339.88]